MYPSDRRDPNEQYAHRHRASYPPMMHAPVPGPYSSATNWKNAHYEGKSLESSRHEEPRKINFSEMSNTEEAPEVAPITKTDVQKELEPEQTAIQSADKTATSEPVTQIVTVARKEERATPASTVKAAASLEEKFQHTLKSPVTMCFERFLGAGKCCNGKFHDNFVEVSHILWSFFKSRGSSTKISDEEGQRKRWPGEC
jgi:hypothetical protein